MCMFLKIYNNMPKYAKKCIFDGICNNKSVTNLNDRDFQLSRKKCISIKILVQIIRKLVQIIRKLNYKYIFFYSVKAILTFFALVLIFQNVHWVSNWEKCLKGYWQITRVALNESCAEAF